MGKSEEDKDDTENTAGETEEPEVDLDSEFDAEEEDIVQINEKDLKRLQHTDYDHPSVTRFFAVVGVVCMFGLIWLVVSVEGLIKLIIPYIKSFLTWLQHLLQMAQ